MAQRSIRSSDWLPGRNWFSTDWISARDALTFGAGTMLMLAASR